MRDAPRGCSGGKGGGQERDHGQFAPRAPTELDQDRVDLMRLAQAMSGSA